MEKRIIAGVLAFCMMINIFSQSTYASYNANSSVQRAESVSNESNSINESVGMAVGSARTVNDVIAQSKFTQCKGHGFAAERGNNLIDRIKGNNARVVGDNNVKNGADRIINRGDEMIYVELAVTVVEDICYTLTEKISDL